VAADHSQGSLYNESHSSAFRPYLLFSFAASHHPCWSAVATLYGLYPAICCVTIAFDVETYRRTSCGKQASYRQDVKDPTKGVALWRNSGPVSMKRMRTEKGFVRNNSNF
jgi:hypothetical protein